MEIFNNILIYFVIVPLLTLLGLALCSNKGIGAIRAVAVAGATVLVALAGYLVYLFLQARGAGDTSEMILRSDKDLFGNGIPLEMRQRTLISRHHNKYDTA